MFKDPQYRPLAEWAPASSMRHEGSAPQNLRIATGEHRYHQRISCGDSNAEIPPRIHPQASRQLKRVFRAGLARAQRRLIACFGVLAAGTRSGSSVPMNGTSAAAPQAARWIAETWLTTGVLPARPNNLEQPGNNPSNPIPPGERPDTVGGGLRPTPQKRGRPS
jgi:hypothetical protein